MASVRQHSPSTDLDDFWTEFKDIESSKEPDGEEEDLAKTPDGNLIFIFRKFPMLT